MFNLGCWFDIVKLWLLVFAFCFGLDLISLLRFVLLLDVVFVWVSADGLLV